MILALMFIVDFIIMSKLVYSKLIHIIILQIMDILYLLVPFSVILVLVILAGLWWAVHSGQFEDTEKEGERILHDD